MARMINNRRQTLGSTEGLLVDRRVERSSIAILSLASPDPLMADRTSARGFGKIKAINGARGRDRRYAPRDPNDVMMVRSSKAGKGLKIDPTKMFCSARR